MLFDWFTVGAQLLNFVILVWLMKRFLYRPVLNAIAAREQKIAAELAAAATAQSEARQQQHELRQKNETFDEQRGALMHQAQKAAKAEGERLQVEARDAADAARAQRAKAQLTEASQLHAEIIRHTQEQVFAIARRVLGELASASLEQQASEVFMRRLRALDGAARATLEQALTTTSSAEPAFLRSAFEWPAAQQAAIQAALDECFGRPIPLKFETAPELVSGIELSAGGQKLAWSIADHLAALSSGLQAQLGATEPA